MKPTPIKTEYSAPIHHRWSYALLAEKEMRPSRVLLWLLLPIFPGFIMALTGVLGTPIGVWLTGLIMIFAPILILGFLEHFSDQYEAHQHRATEHRAALHTGQDDDAGP